MYGKGCSRLLSLFFLLFSVLNPTYAQERPRYIFNDFVYNRSAGRGLPEILTLQLAPEILEATERLVSRVGVPPEKAKEYIQFKRDLINQVTKREGEEETGIFRSPDGYTFCRAEIVSYDPKFQRGASDTTMNVRVLHTRAEDGLGYYTVVPRSWQGTRITLTMQLVFVLADPNPNNPDNVVNLIRRGTCEQQNSCPWLCKSDQCSRGVRNCVPGDARPDRWLAGDY
jgi:hypothetical protein